LPPLRQRMLEDMRIRKFTPNAQCSYQEQVSRFAPHSVVHPRSWAPTMCVPVHLLEMRKLSAW
jgi:hypothetical protein